MVQDQVLILPAPAAVARDRLAVVRTWFLQLFRSYGLIFLCDHPLAGVPLLLASLVHPQSGVLGFGAGLWCLCLGRLAGTPSGLWESGLLGINGILIGMAWGGMFLPTPGAWMGLLLACVAATACVHVCYRLLTVTAGLPLMSLPFVLVVWGTLALHHLTGWLTLANQTPVFVWVQHFEGVAALLLPFPVAEFFRSLAAILLEHEIFAGLLIAATIFYHNAKVFGYMVAGYAVAYFVLAPDGWTPTFRMEAFNCMLVTAALAGYFLPSYRSRLPFGLLVGGICAAVLGMLGPLMAVAGEGLLSAPFNLLTLASLSVARRLEQSQPAAALGTRKVDEIPDEEQRVLLSLPFYGRWYVSQGNFGRPTHLGDWGYAWDFIVVNTDRTSHHGLGTLLHEYYTFGLPVLSPAPGRVVRVVDGVHDNIPKIENLMQNWGNAVVIDHGHREFSVLAHFIPGSIQVGEGDVVERGQMLGRCGNSGRSREPHLHFQMQREDWLGAHSMPCRFSHYLELDGHVERLVEEGVPEERTWVANADS